MTSEHNGTHRVVSFCLACTIQQVYAHLMGHRIVFAWPMQGHQQQIVFSFGQDIFICCHGFNPISQTCSLALKIQNWWRFHQLFFYTAKQVSWDHRAQKEEHHQKEAILEAEGAGLGIYDLAEEKQCAG